MIVAVALPVLAVAALVGWLAGPAVADPPAWRVAAARGSWVLCAGAAVLLVIAGAQGLSGSAGAVDLGTLGPLGPAGLRVDALSGLFLVISFAVAVPVLLAGAVPSAAARPRLGAAVAATLGSVAVVVTADHLFVLLFGWEALTFAFYLLSGYDREKPGRARASVATVTFGKASGAALLLGGLLLAGRAGTFSLAGLHGSAHGALGGIGYGLLLLGFAIKVGLVPVQVWLPPGYAAAPGPARAVMAGVAVNVGFYGMWRTLDILGAPPSWLAVVVLLLAGATAILGIAHAAVHPDLAQLVAWSSVENAGVITAGFGVALVGSAVGNAELTAAGLVAATTQVIAHALGKSLLFMATAAVEESVGTTDLDRLRGVARRLPWSGTGMVVGALTLAGLPLTVGFASEWLTLESLMQLFRVRDLPMQMALAVAAALVALTVGVAGVAFVRLVALTAFSVPSVNLSRRAVTERSAWHRVSVAVLITGCLGIAAAAPAEIRLIATGLGPLVGSTADGALASPWVLQPVFAHFSALSPSWLWVALPALLLIITAGAVALSGARLWQVRRVPAWSSASPGVDRGVGYTSFGWANPMRTVLANLLLTRGQLRQRAAHAPGQPVDAVALPGQSGESGASSSGLGDVTARMDYSVDVVEIVERYLYLPALLVLRQVVRAAKMLQSGRLDAYMAYMLIALVAVLAVVTATR